MTIRRNFRDLSETPLTSPELMLEVGLLASRRIRTRTESGRDAKGQPFVPLSEGYAKQKQEALGNSRADLTVSGRMLNDMGVTAVTDQKAEIGFKSMGGGGGGGTFIQRSRSVGAADKAYYHDVAGAGKSHVKREFFDLSEEDIDVIQDAVDAHIARVIT